MGSTIGGIAIGLSLGFAIVSKLGHQTGAKAGSAEGIVRIEERLRELISEGRIEISSHGEKLPFDEALRMIVPNEER